MMITFKGEDMFVIFELYVLLVELMADLLCWYLNISDQGGINSS